MSFNPPLKHGQLEQVVRDHGHLGFQYLQRWRLHHLFHSLTTFTQNRTHPPTWDHTSAEERGRITSLNLLATLL